MRNILRLFSVLVISGLACPGPVRAQNIGGGTLDLQSGAAGSNQPSSNSGQRFVPTQAGPADPDAEATAPTPPPPAPKRKKKPAHRKPKAPAAAPAQN